MKKSMRLTMACLFGLAICAGLVFAQTAPKEKTPPPGMVSVPAGEFMMGCNEKVDKQCFDAEKPSHKVYLDAFYIDKLEVTQGEYDACFAAGKCGENHKYIGFTDGRQPVVGVTWDDAKSYCAWVGKRLPTEAQWEKAARGTDGRIYPWGNGIIDPSRANYEDSKLGKTREVGSYPTGASPYGALDMEGNAWEWVADWYDGTYYKTSPAKNPSGPDKGEHRVMRGMGWGTGAVLMRASFRYAYADPNLKLNGWGFRCARN